MKNRYAVLIISLFLLLTDTAQGQTLFPAFVSEVELSGDYFYFEGRRFTGLIVDDNTKQRLGEVRNGLKEGIFIELYPDGRKKSEGNFLRGKRNGLYTEWYQNGIKKTEVEYNQDALNGIFKSWYENNANKFEGQYINNRREGLHTSWYENGSIQTEIEYRQNELNGIYNSWSADGKSQYAGQFSNGKKEGLHKEWYDNGNKKSEIEFTQDIPNGIFNTWYDDGKKQYEGRFNKGKKEGSHTEYYPGGIPKISTTFLQDKRQGLYTTYYENGNKYEEYSVDRDQLQGEYTKYYENGIVRVTYTYDHGLISDGTYTIYNETGAKSTVETYSGGSLVGEGVYRGEHLYEFKTEYHPGSQIKHSEGLTKDGLKDSLWTFWHSNGQVMESAYYMDDMLHGACMQWYSNGDMKIEASYDNGKLKEVIYENPVSPEQSVLGRYKAGAYLFRITSPAKGEDVFAMVVFNYQRSQADALVRDNILKNLSLRFEKINENDIQTHGKKLLRYHIEFQNPRYNSYYDDGKRTVLGGLVEVEGMAQVGYKGTVNNRFKVEDLDFQRKLVNVDSEFFSVTKETYTYSNTAVNNAHTSSQEGVITAMNKIFGLRVNITGIPGRDRKGFAKDMLIDHGYISGIWKKATFNIFSVDDPDRRIGIIEISHDPSRSTSTCKVKEGKEVMARLFDRGGKLFGIYNLD